MLSLVVTLFLLMYGIQVKYDSKFYKTFYKNGKVEVLDQGSQDQD
jgi:hypothetical protein